MTKSSRLLKSLAAAAFAALLAGTALAEGFAGLDRSTSTGGYMAGTQALFDLRTADAAHYFRAALKADGDNPRILERAFIAFASNGDMEEAASVARRVIETTPGNDLARLVVAAVALKQRRYDSVIDLLQGLGRETLGGITGGILQAWAFAGAGRIDDANRLLDEYARNGFESVVVFQRALVAEIAGQSDKALDLAAQAYDSDPFVPRIVEAYTRMLGNAGRFDEAEDVLAQYTSEGNQHPLIDAVKVAIDKRQRPGAFATDVQTGAAEMLHGIGLSMARDGTTDLSFVFLQLGLYLNPRADTIALLLGNLLDGAGQHEAANAVYDRIPATSPMKPTAVVSVAQNLESMGDRDEAIGRLENIVLANPADIEALTVLGNLQRGAQRYDAAAASYGRIIDLQPGDSPADWRYYYMRGISFERNQEWPKAESDFKRALELRPNQPNVLNYLGYSWVDQGVNLEPALEMIEKAVAAAPNDGYIIDSLGWAFYRLGRYDEAVEALEQAVRLQPDDPEINDHLGDAYWHVGRKLEANFQWKVAVALDEEGNVKARATPKLVSGLDAVPVTAESAPVEPEATAN